MTSGGPVEISPWSTFTDNEGFSYPANWLENSTADERSARQIVQIAETAVPAGKLLASRQLQLFNGVPTFVDTYADPPPPAVVSRMQAKRFLLTQPSTSGDSTKTLLDDMDTYIAASGDRNLQLYWSETSDFHIDHPEITTVSTAMHWTSAQLDGFFTAASQLT